MIDFGLILIDVSDVWLIFLHEFLNVLVSVVVVVDVVVHVVGVGGCSWPATSVYGRP